jgi:glycosyltransferase involved in cell wall biosynthesis
MGADDFGELNRDVLDKTVVYSHSSERVPLIPNVARYWFVSEFARQSSRELASASHTCIILNPVRERFFNQSLRSSREFRIGRHSRPSKTKFPTDLWTLFETIRVPGLTISILGAHEQLRSEFLSGRESLRHSYELLEFNTRDCAEYLTSLNVYLYKVSTEINEACPLSVLEAMACGLPVIAEDRAGLQEIIANRRTGFLCSESAEFAAVAEELWRDPFLRSSIGKAARKWAQENVTISAYRARVTKALEWMGAS